ncbi:MAG: PEP-CTERM sorting domain-containing protein [Planctomycetaceae bacterium]|nr:PEP-CTERM sorting domain-containing protein [Planctomycetaceae bacterium]
MCRRLVLAMAGILLLGGAHGVPAYAVLNPLAYYHLGEDDAGATTGGTVVTTVDSLGLTPGIEMTPLLGSNALKYSSDKPSFLSSTRSITFDASEETLSSVATKWYEGTGSFRWGMEVFLKPDASMAGRESIFFTNGTQFTMGITTEGFFYVNQTGPGTTAVKYGEWQHVAFTTSGSFWQIYVDGVPQFPTQPNFTYGAPGGTATLGSSNGAEVETSYTGLMDEHRVFSWTGGFNPNELLWFSGRKAGDVNEDGLVNSADYDIWRANVGVDLTPLTALQGRALGDLNGDRQINLADFGLIKSNKSPGAVLAVPEPAGAAILLTGIGIVALRQRRRLAARTCKTFAMLGLVAAIMGAASTASAQAVAVWGGGNGNWNDANWSGGSGPGGRPGAGDSITLPPTTGTLTVSSNLGLSFDKVIQQGGILDITPAGSLDLTGVFENGRGAGPNGGEVRVAGSLTIGGELDVAYDVAGRVRVLGSGTLNIAGNMDTWWTGAGIVDLTGGSTNVTVGATYYWGPSATINANINSAAFAPIKVNTELSIQGGTLNVNFTDGFVPTTSNSWTLFDAAARAGAITNVNGNGLAPGTRLAVNYGAGGTLGQVVTIDVDSTLNLKVNQSTGVITLENPAAGATAMNIDGYIIRSASNSLVPGSFTGVGSVGWLPGTAPSQSAKLISETNFNGSLNVTQGGSYPLGAIFASGGSQDLSLEFHLASGETLVGTVQYIGTPGFAADFNSNGFVDGADLALWKIGYGKASGAVKSDGDFNLDGRVDGADFLGWQRQFGSGTPPIAAIPEPGSVLLAAMSALVVAGVRKQRS